jgi:hypothetical protein
MKTEKVTVPTQEHLEDSLKRLRKRLTYVQDEMQITSFAIKAIEHDLQEMIKEDSKANEANEKKITA